MLTNAAGIGGGGAILPIMMLWGFTPKVGVALSNTIIFIGAVTRFVMDFNSHHPEKKATLIDYGIVILMLPSIMIGSFLGVQFNVVLPQAAVLILLGSILCYVSYKSTQQGLKLLREERKENNTLKSLIGKLLINSISTCYRFTCIDLLIKIRN